MVVGRARLGVGYSLQGAFLVFRFLCTFCIFNFAMTRFTSRDVMQCCSNACVHE